jgi:hypothetical protein
MNIHTVEEGYNTSAVVLRAWKLAKRKSSAWGYNWAAPSLGDITTETWSFRSVG